MRKQFTSITTFTALAASSSQILTDQYDDNATTDEFDYIAVGVGSTASL